MRLYELGFVAYDIPMECVDHLNRIVKEVDFSIAVVKFIPHGDFRGDVEVGVIDKSYSRSQETLSRLHNITKLYQNLNHN